MITFAARLSLYISLFYIIKTILFPMFKPLSKRQKKTSRSYIKERKALDKKERKRVRKQELALKYCHNLVSSADRIRYNKVISRLELNIKPEELRLEQLTYVGIAIVVTLIMFTANDTLGYVSVIFIVLGWLYPIDELEKKIELKDKNIAFDFPAFYSMVYYQYSRSVHLYLADVIRDFLPNANDDMAEELGIMLDNIEYGEHFALKELKKRVPLHYVIKFCDIMETRLKGYDNVTQMTFLKNEIDEFRILNLEKELESRKAANERIQWILIGVLVVYIIIYYLFMILQTIDMFR